MASCVTFWTLSCLLLLAFEAVAQEVLAYTTMGWDGLLLGRMFVSASQVVSASFLSRHSFLTDFAEVPPDVFFT